MRANLGVFRMTTNDGEYKIGGGSGIRTHVTVARKHAFQACAFNRSATPPSQPARRWYGREGAQINGGPCRAQRRQGPQRRAISLRAQRSDPKLRPLAARSPPLGGPGTDRMILIGRIIAVLLLIGAALVTLQDAIGWYTTRVFEPTVVGTLWHKYSPNTLLLAQPPIPAWMAMRKSWRGISSFKRSHSARPRRSAWLLWTMTASASTGSPLTRMFMRTRSPSL